MLQPLPVTAAYLPLTSLRPVALRRKKQSGSMAAAIQIDHL